MDDLPELPGVSHRFVRAGEITMHVAEAGSGPPLMLVHGWPEHWYAWRRLIPELALDHRVICPDLRGLGWSDAPEGGYGKQTLADDLLALMDALELQRVQYVGHDWGAYCGYLAAVKAPERFERLALLSMTTPGAARATPKAAALTPVYMSYQFILSAPVLGPLALTATSRLLDFVFRTWPRLEMGDVETYVERLKEPARARASGHYYRSFLLRELPATLAGRYDEEKPDVPMLKLMGEHDWISKVAGEEPGTIFIPNAGHFIPEESPQEVLEHLRAFLNGEEPPSGDPPQHE